jgi:DNA-binding NarL/FixJ family response regulator
MPSQEAGFRPAFSSLLSCTEAVALAEVRSSAAPAAVPARARFADAMHAWHAGDVARCLALCERVRPQDRRTQADLAFLCARAYLRLGRGADARAAIETTFFGEVDASITAQMLLGAAEVQMGDLDRGLARLRAARAASELAHPTVRAESALRLAYGLYAARDLTAASQALDDVGLGADIVSASALNLRAWIATARADYAAATAAFVDTLCRLDTCYRKDRFLEANSLAGLAIFAAERFDCEAAAFVASRAGRIDWTADGLVRMRRSVVMSNALTLEAEGRSLEAIDAAYSAAEIAPTIAYRIGAMCRRASIERGIGETVAQLSIVRSAHRQFSALDPARLEGDEITVPLDLAEELAAAGLADEAREVFAVYRSLRPISAVLSMHGDPRNAAHELLVQATIADAAGDREAAIAGYAEALRAFDAIGYWRRAVTAALRRAALTREDSLYEYAASHTVGLDPKFWMRRQVLAREELYRDPRGRPLTPTQREIFALLGEDLTNAEIAERTGRALQTVKNVVSSLYDAFGVSTRRALRSEYRRRTHTR